jgi:CRISPR type III-B/RAMP module-associated protein Cmr5
MISEPVTLEQKIAAKALELVNKMRATGDSPSPAETEYRSHIEGLPAMLRTCGLSRTLAFLKARNETPKKIAAHLEEQFQYSGILDPAKELQKQLAQCSLREYRAYARVALMVALWHKRIAQARLRPKEEKK